mgnify:CR=1 FL=1|tara:strand:+ start:133 stop:411 length:279 start_codon:yes stop_codon:yes gene_type:complete
MPSRTVTICNVKGLHARAAAKFVKCAEAFQAEITVETLDNPAEQVGARSILGLMMLGASKGTVLELKAEGPDADQALDALVLLIESRFEEES